MDAKVGDWVVTPRRGKAVEINALWYNALRLMAGWMRGRGPGGRRRRIRDGRSGARAFNQRFWYEPGGYLYDVVDAENGGSDDACRPNQIFAIRSITRCSTKSMETRNGRGDRAPAHARWVAFSRTRASRLQGRNIMATCAPAMPHTIRAQCGRGSSGLMWMRGES